LVVGLTVLIADWLVACADDVPFLLTSFGCPVFFIAVAVVLAVFYSLRLSIS